MACLGLAVAAIKVPGKIHRPMWISEWAELLPEFEAICAKHKCLKNTNNHKHLGTLGTGNHFIEVCLDESQNVWFMLHSGSRGVGNRIGTHFIELAKKDMEKYLHPIAG